MDVDSLKAVGGSSNTKNDYSAITSQFISNRVKEKTESRKVDAKDNNKDVSDMTMSDKSKGLGAVSDVKKSVQEDDLKDENFIDRLDKAVEAANKVLKPTNKSFAYSIHEATNEIMITITDSETGEIIKEIPSKETLDRVAKMRELAYGSRSSGGMVIDAKK